MGVCVLWGKRELDCAQGWRNSTSSDLVGQGVLDDEQVIVGIGGCKDCNEICTIIARLLLELVVQETPVAEWPSLTVSMRVFERSSKRGWMFSALMR